MEKRYAKQLHNGDQVTIKETKETVEVISTEVKDDLIVVYAMTENGYSTLTHKEIRKKTKI